MKAVLVIIVLVVVYMFYPQYDLIVKQSPFDEEPTLEGTGYLTEGSCREAAQAINARYFHCSSKNLWGELFGTYTSYREPERYSDPKLFEDLQGQ
ncbi:hypothetical protein Q8A57_10285 [Porticoccus litoralis]|uniref:Uncharacterized protein n=1 Tax=Porticoccus litoralis TaxID=434086 RepID=A0AAW8B4S1_9GAMM|nr:hypothetical protein [Porticoccus litoralis]MDP1521358.1 hypothetical protein [Porticoccus litoralis]